jgi:hypothetical protein
MSYFVTPFEVSAKALPHPVRVRFVHLLSGITPRHSDTIDCVFWVDGSKVIVAISCAALAELREKDGRSFKDQELAEIAALHLRRTLQEGYDARQAELMVDAQRLRDLGRELQFL